MPVVRSREAESLTVTRLLVPLKDSALPNLPAVVHVAPSIEVANIGVCANRTIEIDTNASADDMAVVLVRHTAEIQGENCFTDAADAKLEKKSKGARVVRIDFDPSIWKSE